MELKDKKAVVVGAGRSGIAAARFLAAQGARVVLNDAAALGHLAGLAAEGITLSGGGHRRESFAGCELIVLSPGVPATGVPLEALLAEAERGGAEVISELELGARFISAPILAVTGTNGKSTTTTLLGGLMEASGRRTFTGGNLGTPLTEHLLSGETAEAVVLEVSSFQLERIVSFRPQVAILLNITPDHLDRYPSMEAYVAAKRRLFMNQTADDCAVMNMEDETVAGIAAEIPARIIPFALGGEGRGGLFIDGGMLRSEIPGHELSLPLARLREAGIHHMENAMAAIGAALLLGVTEETVLKALKAFKGLPHRMEWVAEAEGIAFYDDSKATNVGAVVKSLGSLDRPIVLIAGGRDKGGSYAPLRAALGDRVRGIVLIGEAAPLMEAALRGAAPLAAAATLEEAVERAWQMAEAGDAVVLSPACSSFDMFKNYIERGKTFQGAARRIAAEHSPSKPPGEEVFLAR